MDPEKHTHYSRIGDLLLKGTRWEVSEDTKINIWEDPWIPNLPNFKLES